MTQQYSTFFLQWKPRKRTTEPLLQSSHCWNSSPSFIWICKQRLWVCGSQSKQWQMQTRLPVRRILMELLVCMSYPQGLLSSPWHRYPGLGGSAVGCKVSLGYPVAAWWPAIGRVPHSGWLADSLYSIPDSLLSPLKRGKSKKNICSDLELGHPVLTIAISYSFV